MQKDVTSPWDGRKLKSMANVTGQSPNIIYLIICNCGNHYDYAWYVGSTTQICNKGGRTTGPNFYSKKEKNVGLHITLRKLILWYSPIHLRHLPGVCQEGDQAVRKNTMEKSRFSFS